MKNTQAATLIGFAGNSSRGGSHHWPNRLAPGTLLGFRDTNSSFGLASDPNLQFVYDIETQAFTQNPELSEALIEDLSKKLQRSFNYGFAPRHYYPNTEEFPWQEYNMQLKW